MIRFLLRFLGLWILAAAFIFLVYDGAGWVANGALNSVRSINFGPTFTRTACSLLQPAVERYVSPWLWNPVIMTVLEQPVWLVFGIIGAALILLGRKKKPLIGYVRD